jgi:3-oxoacyl-[acyl-carrier-protein] synthase II
MYIRATSCISPQYSFEGAFLSSPVAGHEGNRFNALEPEYKDLIDPKLIRRMSRIIKMGSAAALKCLQQAALDQPGAIVVGSAYGCLEDTGIFLKKMIENKEEMLTPTAFIQSTHNTVGAQIALAIKCHRYNNTFVHRGFSFESALLDALMLLSDKEADTVLAGSADEITDYSHSVLSRMGIYRNGDFSSKDLFSAHAKGTVGGEGTCFFLLTRDASPQNLAKLDGLSTFYKPAGPEAIDDQIGAFLDSQTLVPGDIDLVITGMNGDSATDETYTRVLQQHFPMNRHARYKHLCGEYPTSSSFALWLAVNICREQRLPAMLASQQINTSKPFKRVLIYNHYKNTHHSLLLVSAC